jgi:drug/metabolite transporter (DMT)-like permease
MAVGTKALSKHIAGPQIVVLRMTFGLCVFAAMAIRQPKLLSTSRPKWLAARGLFGGVSVLIYFVSIDKVGVGMATLIHYSAPVWAALLGWAVLKERLQQATLIALALALAGVSLVMGPTIAEAWRLGAQGAVSPGWYFLALSSAFVSAAALVSVRAARRTSSTSTAPPDHVWTLFGSFSLFGLIAAAPFAVAPLGHWMWPSTIQWLLMFGVAIVSVLAQVIMTQALAHVPASAPGVANQFSVVIASVAGVIWFNEHITALSFFGAFLIVLGVLASFRARPPS